MTIWNELILGLLYIVLKIVMINRGLVMSQKDSMQELKINLCVPEVGWQILFNADNILAMIGQICANDDSPQPILFPQLCLSAFTCEDLFSLLCCGMPVCSNLTD